MPVFHFDTYRLKDDDEFLALGPEEYFDADGITFVEWADRVERLYGRSRRSSLRSPVMRLDAARELAGTAGREGGSWTARTRQAVVNAGADAVVVSNHGGRQLDRSPTPLEQLPAIVAAVGGRAEVYSTAASSTAPTSSGRGLRRPHLPGRAGLPLRADGRRGAGRAAGRGPPVPRGDPHDAAARRDVGRRADPERVRLRSGLLRVGSGPWTSSRSPLRRGVRVHLRRGGAAAPRRPGTALRLWSEDAFCGALRRSRTCRARRSTCARQPADRARSGSRAPSRATRWRCTSWRWSPRGTGAPPRRSRSSAG